MTMIYRRLAHILVLLPASAGELADALGLQLRTVQNWLRELCAAGLIARGEFRQREGRVFVRAEASPVQRVGWRYRADALHRFVQAWHALRARHTTDTLAATLGVHRRTASEMVRALREHGLVKRAGWEMRGQTPTPVYDRLPRAADAPRPPTAPRAVTNAKHWLRRRQRQGADALGRVV